MTVEQARKVLEKAGQAHVLRFWDTLGAAERDALLAQISEIDFGEVARMQRVLADKNVTATVTPRPAPVVKWTRRTYGEAFAAGEEQLRKGRVAVLLVAGGQGSRLGYEGPKGAYGIGPVSGMPLFYFHARKIVRLARLYGRPVPFYVMTSEVNDAATRACFEDHDYFGLNPADVIFFKQGVWPALDAAGRLILEVPGRIFVSPDGHGGTLTALAKNGCLDDMTARGIRSVFYFQVDNPLVDIADPAFIGIHALCGAELSLKLCLKRTPTEKMGAVSVLDNGRYGMIEYSEMTPRQAARFKYGSPAIHVFSLAFLKREARKDMPLHLAHKKIACVDDAGRLVKPDEPNGYKFEKFIFDVLPDARTVVNLAFDRDDEFSPVKNATGEDSPVTCRMALQAKWRRWLAAAGVTIPESIPVEIDPASANSAEELKRGLLLG
ncbi:MAG TPA: UDPGP type 1 family protein [Kiritimatiellia bacterium]|nr:UDPGP type 1 family protein [Kiritimatiellia bacterium]HRU70090.1 UDPGP type 1 family protein [Kiritimatiellia bacterium]